MSQKKKLFSEETRFACYVQNFIHYNIEFVENYDDSR